MYYTAVASASSYVSVVTDDPVTESSSGKSHSSELMEGLEEEGLCSWTDPTPPGAVCTSSFSWSSAAISARTSDLFEEEPAPFPMEREDPGVVRKI